jgi:hypothetical protein
MAMLLSALPDDPSTRLLNRDVLDFLVDHPIERPRLDPSLLRRLRDSLPDGFDNDPLRLSVYRLDRQQLLAAADDVELPD